MKKLLSLIRRVIGSERIQSSLDDISAATKSLLERQLFLTGQIARSERIQSSLGDIFAATKSLLERQLFLTGQIACRQVRQLDRLTMLADAEFRVTSQFGEDGIIDWLCHVLPNVPHSFIELGVGDYQEANTRFLLQNRNWRGLIIDGISQIEHVRGENLYWMYDLTALKSFVTAENINPTISGNGFAGDIGILSVDLDGNDYWVLKAIECVKPMILITEYNGIFGDRHAITIPYNPAFERHKAHHSGRYYGASVRAMISLAAEKGFEFIGTNSAGVNAFFVRKDCARPVTDIIDKVKAWPAQHRDGRDADGILIFTRGNARVEQIASEMVYDIESRGMRSIQSLFPLYSSEWEQED